MRRRQARSPQNHALVASVAGVILLCGVVSVQTTQASQAFSHEQGMARMAAPQGSDAGATTPGDATWWSFWRAVRTLPHAYDAATATVLGAGDRGHASLDRALAEKRAEIERLRAQTAALKAEQARILDSARARRRRTDGQTDQVERFAALLRRHRGSPRWASRRRAPTRVAAPSRARARRGGERRQRQRLWLARRGGPRGGFASNPRGLRSSR